MFGATVSDLQEDVEFDGKYLNGKLKYFDDESTELVQYWGPGYFMALQFEAESGVALSAGLENIVELDSDMNGVFKVENPINQTFKVVAVSGANTEKHVYDLSGLTLVRE